MRTSQAWWFGMRCGQGRAGGRGFVDGRGAARWTGGRQGAGGAAREDGFEHLRDALDAAHDELAPAWVIGLPGTVTPRLQSCSAKARMKRARRAGRDISCI